MKLMLTITRYIVGILFIFSGLVKANDPLGLSYKMQEFFEVWGMHNLNDYTLAFSILMIAFEIIAGVAVIVGWQMRLFSWLLLLLIIFFTFLTAYALFSGKIKTCGCFGDCIPLTAAQSFTKDLVLLFLILVLFRYRNSIKTSMDTRKSLLLLGLTTLFSFGFQWYVLRHLPVVDCLPYKKGKNIASQMKIPAGAIPDSTVITFVYNKKGQEVEFTADQFPEDFDESVYQFVKRYDKLVRKGNAEPPVKDFVLLAASGADTTQAILAQSGLMQWLFIKEINKADLKELKQTLLELREIAESRKMPIYIITPVAEDVLNLLAAEIGNTPVFRSDAVAVKTAARYPVTLYLLSDGTIVNKWALKDNDKAIQMLSGL
ncbi:BT_3928 family protein [Flavihumibacter stibioxidans]|uniref:DoxX family protein n=1 Tax=Flavihumibacter stibioxidans TaxID=1834163 RepID=A0ABR7M3T3_9BACT|nr:BT_3928 family protein [Flavihumibacter stibioxidans]MBC6489509.1 DoxX family protein [Flavihumibacter stibioxidans]